MVGIKLWFTDGFYDFKSFHVIPTVRIDDNLFSDVFLQTGYQSILFTMEKFGDFRIYTERKPRTGHIRGISENLPVYRITYCFY